MRAKPVRLATVGFGAITMLGVLTPPASGTTIKVSVLVGKVVVAGGLGYPCVGAQCPQGIGGGGTPLVTVTETQLQGSFPVTNATVGVHGGSFRFMSFRGDNCIEIVIHINKPKAPAAAGDCVVTATGFVDGWCGLGNGQGVATSVDPKGVVYDIAFVLQSIGGLVVIDGHKVKRGSGSRGKIVVTALAMPAQSVPGGPSCTSGTATEFLLVGEGPTVIPNV